VALACCGGDIRQGATRAGALQKQIIIAGVEKVNEQIEKLVFEVDSPSL
jgi:hypothetical protein